jgi:ArsR family transcriptional regulator
LNIRGDFPLDNFAVLKAIADETRIKVLTLLLKHNYCVRALARELSLSESTVSQHLKVLRDTGLIVGEKRGYFMHYDVQRAMLCKLADEIGGLATVPRRTCTQKIGKCNASEHAKCHVKVKNCSKETIDICHGKQTENKRGEHHGNCGCRRP